MYIPKVRFPLIALWIGLLGVALLSACSRPTPILEKVKQSGTLNVATRNSPTTYYEGPDGLTGLEYDLVGMFAEELGVEPNFIVPENFDDIIPMVRRGDVHFAAAGLTVTAGRASKVRFGPPYQTITQQVVYKAGYRRPRKISDLIGKEVEIIAGSSHEEELELLARENFGLEWRSHREINSEELLYLVQEEIIDYTVADSNEVAMNRRYYPKLKVAFDLSEPQNLAWAFPHAEDSSLFKAALKFFKRIKKDGILEQMLERYYGHVERLNFVDNRTFKRHVALRLPSLIPAFKKASRITEIDWQLLAAVGYQESHWNPKAVSPTGVRGIMMLTQATANQLGIEDRLDPEQSIIGGARYMRLMEKKIPKRIQEPDRLWLALAGYNVGFGHLEDARILTQRQGGDPDKWADVKKRLPLLSQKKWYKTTRHGYARGREPVNYVDNIRSYYDLLKWYNKRQQETKPKERDILSIAPKAM